MVHSQRQRYLSLRGGHNLGTYMSEHEPEHSIVMIIVPVHVMDTAPSDLWGYLALAV